MPPRSWRRPIPSARGDVLSLKEWLGAKRRFYAWWLLACLLSALVVPIAMHWIRIRLPEIEWADSTMLTLGMPWWLAAWFYPIAYTAAVALLLVALEGLVYFLRVDRGDHAWSSIGWTMRGWRTAAAWTLLPLVFVALAAAVRVGEGWWVMIVYADGLGLYALPLVLPFFAFKPGYVGAARPVLWSPPAWPGWMPVLLLLGFPILSLVVTLLLMSKKESFPEAPSWLGVVGFCALVTLVFFLSLAGSIAWLNAARKPKLLECIRAAIRPRVFAPCIVQAMRWHFFAVLLLLVAFPVWWFLVEVLPGLEGQLACCLAPDLQFFVDASRSAVAWWWALSLVGYASFQYLLSWFGEVGGARLLQELGQVGDAAAATAPR